MATYGDDLGRQSDGAAMSDPGPASRRGVAGEVPTGLPAPALPPSALPPPSHVRSPFPAPGTTPSMPAAVPPSTSVPTCAGSTGAPPHSYTDIRAVHEATTQQLRERRTSPGSGRPIAVACAVVVLGGIAFVLGTVLL